MTKNEIEEKLKGEGFEPEPIGFSQHHTDLPEGGWKLLEFKREKDGEVPELLLGVKRYEKYGINILLTSIPYDNHYTFATGSPVSEERVLTLLEGYISSAKEGRKYNGA
ncbi:MAG: hypothetical protein KC516_04515 [Nanoarchaeota archaeon]|nr:hypothetical protein [Nanoarchaeota archaeon]